MFLCDARFQFQIDKKTVPTYVHRLSGAALPEDFDLTIIGPAAAGSRPAAQRAPARRCGL